MKIDQRFANGKRKSRLRVKLTQRSNTVVNEIVLEIWIKKIIISVVIVFTAIDKSNEKENIASCLEL